MALESVHNGQSIHAWNTLNWCSYVLWRHQVQRLGMLDNELSCFKWNRLMKLLEVTQHPVRSECIFMVTADKHFVILVVCDVLVHGFCGGMVM